MILSNILKRRQSNVPRSLVITYGISIDLYFLVYWDISLQLEWSNLSLIFWSWGTMGYYKNQSPTPTFFRAVYAPKNRNQGIPDS